MDIPPINTAMTYNNKIRRSQIQVYNILKHNLYQDDPKCQYSPEIRCLYSMENEDENEFFLLK